MKIKLFLEYTNYLFPYQLEIITYRFFDNGKIQKLHKIYLNFKISTFY
jgi:hypothetical protein